MARTTTSAGFTLVEIAVSIVIVLITIFLYSAALNTVFTTKEVAHDDIALRIATNKIEELRNDGYGSLPSSGTFSDSLSSQLTNASSSAYITDFNSKTKQVVVIVSWTEPGKGTHTISLSTLITQIGSL